MSNAFNEALALESVGEIGVFDASTGTYSGVTSDALAKYARTVAYKVFHNLKHGRTMSKEDDPLTVDGVRASEAWAHHYEAPSQDALLKAMVGRFLGWKLPEDFGPDNGIKFVPYVPHEDHCWPVGTNLFTADQALEMFKHCLPVELVAQGATDHQCCGKCITSDNTKVDVLVDGEKVGECQPVEDIDPITKSAYERTIQDLARRLMTADSLIVSLVTAAGGEVTITDEALASTVDKMIDSSVSDDKRSITFRVVDVDLPAVQ